MPIYRMFTRFGEQVSCLSELGPYSKILSFEVLISVFRSPKKMILKSSKSNEVDAADSSHSGNHKVWES